MPNRAYRIRLRRLGATRYIIPPIFLNDVKGETEIVQIRNYFDYVTDLLIKQTTIAETVSVLQGIISQVKTRTEYYSVLDTIENQVLSVICNMSDHVTPGIIKLRLECIRNSILDLPIEGPEYGSQNMHDMLFHILDLIGSGMSFSNISENILQLQKYTLEAYNQNQLLTQIQTTILDIICNISQGTPSGVIACRVDFLKGLIAKLELAD
jgi:hypothetical protein